MSKRVLSLAAAVFISLAMCIAAQGSGLAQTAQQYVDSGYGYYQQGNYDRAIEDFNKALNIDPKNDAALFDRALAYRNRGIKNNDMADYDRSLVDLNKLLEYYPGHPKIADIYIARANCYHDKGDLDSAISEYTRAISAGPNNALAYENRGLMYSKKDNIDAAISDYSKAIQLNPSKAAVYADRASVYVARGDSDDAALADFNKAISLDPRLGIAYSGRAVLYFLMQDYDKSWADVHKAQQLGAEVMPQLVDELKRATGKDK